MAHEIPIRTSTPDCRRARLIRFGNRKRIAQQGATERFRALHDEVPTDDELRPFDFPLLEGGIHHRALHRGGWF